MSNDEVRKLLGGYATNTLTEAERKALFEAALDDQELFDALHQEQALKDLLDDPVSRDQIRRALDKPAAGARWPRWWAWTGAASAVAAAVLIIAVLRPTPPVPLAQKSLGVTEPALAQPTEKLEADSSKPPARPRAASARTVLDSDKAVATGKRAAAATSERSDSKDAIALSAPAPENPPPPVQAAAPPAASNETRGTDTEGLNQQVQNAQAQNKQLESRAENQVAILRDQKQDQLAPSQLGAGAIAGFLKSPALTYSVLKRDSNGGYQPLTRPAELKSGDEIRLMVAPPASGYLTLSRQDASGQWMRLFPEEAPGIPVNAHSNYTIPNVPITVTGSDQNLRLTLLPTSGVEAVTAREFRAKAKTAPMKKESNASAQPLTVDITLGPKKDR